jgi:hypothetical protein
MSRGFSLVSQNANKTIPSGHIRHCHDVFATINQVHLEWANEINSKNVHPSNLLVGTGHRVDTGALANGTDRTMDLPGQ